MITCKDLSFSYVALTSSNQLSRCIRVFPSERHAVVGFEKGARRGSETLLILEGKRSWCVFAFVIHEEAARRLAADAYNADFIPLDDNMCPISD
ncbi:hypothetical protein M514_00123 [Trichuris suis]|uniref:Uncharacterized protein n=1 Tax=Trichuris suis TaxID=68888 RepID=A0A085NU41_9BILA|nr:hypothetical protein M513_00123 [Trichuris suis]KFD72987.1 hypothetical protein M514_00123 [Trichuris suis]